MAFGAAFELWIVRLRHGPERLIRDALDPDQERTPLGHVRSGVIGENERFWSFFIRRTCRGCGAASPALGREPAAFGSSLA